MLIQMGSAGIFSLPANGVWLQFAAVSHQQQGSLKDHGDHNMKTRSKLSDSGKIRVRAYVGACTAWAAGGYEALADVQHGYFDPVSKNSVTVDDENPLYGETLGVAGSFNFVIDPRLDPQDNVNSGTIFAARPDEFGNFVNSDLAFALVPGTQKRLMYSVVLGTYYYGSALKRYTDGEVIDGQAILDAAGTQAYTAGYLFQFDNPNGGPQAGQFNTGANFDGYLGFAFTKDSTLHTGWIFVEAIGNEYKSFQILDWYYGTGTVLAGDGRPPLQPQETVPEPSSLGLLAVGAAGILRYRGRRTTTESALDSQSAA